MVGSLNANLVNLVQKTINELTLSTNHLALSTDFITYGRKGRDVMVKSHKEVLADFEKYDRVITTQDIAPIANFITNIYSSGKYQKVLIFYNHFVSTLMQKPTVKQLLPFTPSDVIARSASDEAISSENKKIASDALAMTSKQTDYLFEPDPKEVLEHLLPRIIESQIYQTILESEASEQSARMVMMKNATEAAGDLISDLTLTYNKLRQNKITTELAEITAGKIALE
jgi:F-type H+-transporting ATPase subunit gamma